VAVRTARPRDNDPAALIVDKVADEVFREVIATPLVHRVLIALLRWSAAFGKKTSVANYSSRPIGHGRRLGWEKNPPIKRRRRNAMKYLVTWTFRSFGSVAEQEASATRLLKVYSKWAPPASVTYHEFLGRIDGSGGYQVVETDSPADLAEATAQFTPFADFQVEPVLDVADAVAAAQAGIEFRESIH
jgi:hypothetical protein